MTVILRTTQRLDNSLQQSKTHASITTETYERKYIMSDTFGSELVADLTKEMEANDSRTVDQRVHDAIVKSDPIEIHPDAELFPLMVDCEDGSSGFASLIADIKLNHVNEPLVVSMYLWSSDIKIPIACRPPARPSNNAIRTRWWTRLPCWPGKP